MSIIGPVLPPSKDSSKSETNVDNDDVGDVYGPRLPPKHLDGCNRRKSESSPRLLGPTLPPEILAKFQNVVDSDVESDDSDEIIGPILPSVPASESAVDVFNDIEKRASKMKQKLSGKPDSAMLEREEWMTVLPPEMSKNFGLGPRSFQRQTPQKTGDRSGWTETPSTSSERKEKSESKSKQSKDEDKLKRKTREKYDEEMSKIADKHHKKSKRDESLYDMHTKNLKRKKDKDASSEPRRPFDRDQDLRVNVMDNTKRAALVKKSKLLNANFAHGEGKYL